MPHITTFDHGHIVNRDGLEKNLEPIPNIILIFSWLFIHVKPYGIEYTCYINFT